jgi:hypothetical protein
LPLALGARCLTRRLHCHVCCCRLSLSQKPCYCLQPGA